MDSLLFIKSQRRNKYPPPTPFFPFAHPLVATGLVDWSNHLQVKGRIQVAILLFLQRSLHPKKEYDDRQKIKQSLMSEIYNFSSSDISLNYQATGRK